MKTLLSLILLALVPSLWGQSQIALENQVKGSLTIATGETLTLSDVMAGSCLFAGTAGLVSQDNANCFRDQPNNTFGFGTTRTGAISGTNPLLRVKGTGATSATSSFEVMDSSGATVLFARNDGVVGVGTNDPGSNLDIKAATTPFGNEAGNLRIVNAADTNKRLFMGIDATVGANGVGFIQALRSGVAYIPLLLQGAGGDVRVGPLTASRLVASDADKDLVSSMASSVLIDSVTDETGSGLLVFGTGPTLGAPVIADFTAAAHDHGDADDGGAIVSAAVPANLKAAAITIVIDGGGSVITTGVKRGTRSPIDCTPTDWEIVEDSNPPVSSSAVIDLWGDTYGNFPATVADTITGSEKPTLSSTTKNQDASLTTWLPITAGMWLRPNVDSVTSAFSLIVSIQCAKT